MLKSLSRRGAVVLAVALGFAPAPCFAQVINGFGPQGRMPFAGFGGLPGMPGSFNVLNGFGPVGDTRIWPSQQPLLTVYNGQTSLLQIQTFQWFPTNVQAVQSGGQVAFVPQYQPLPV